MTRTRYPDARPRPDQVAQLAGVAEPVGPGIAGGDDPFGGLAAAHAVIAGGRHYTAEVMDRAPELLAICRTGIGVDRVDLEAATRRGIVVCNTPDAPTASTAEHAIALMLAVAKRLKRCEAEARAGGDDHLGRLTGLELAGKTLGLVGVGRIGARVARVARALDMTVKAHDPYVGAEQAERVGVVPVDSLEELLATSDVVSLHLPLTTESRGMIGAARLARMRPGSILVNTARGALVETEALLHALEEGRLAGAGLDVTDPEPLPAGHPLLHRDDVVVTPHVATATGAARRRLVREAITQALQVFEGDRPPNVVNPEVWEVRRVPAARRRDR